MAEKNDKRPIIIKRGKKHKLAPYGGAWKIAYADFVTAMMAFFLLMWLISSTPQDKLVALSEFFNDPKGFIENKGVGNEIGQLLKSELVDNNKDSKSEEDKDQNQKEMETLMKTLMSAIEASDDLRQFSDNIEMQLSDQGIVINLVDAVNRPIFKKNSFKIEPHILRMLQKFINLIEANSQNHISIEGHTNEGEYLENPKGDKWILSMLRANEVRKIFEKNKMAERILRVIAKADLEPYDAGMPDDFRNSRIVIILLDKNSVSNHNRALPREGQFME